MTEAYNGDWQSKQRRKGGETTYNNMRKFDIGYATGFECTKRSLSACDQLDEGRCSRAS